MKTDRRSFLRNALGVSSATLLGSIPGWRSARALARSANSADGLLPPPDESGVEHVVVVMMENRSFDHLLGWLPNADGQQAGLTYFDSDGAAHDTAPLAPDFTGRGHADPSHSYNGGRIQYGGGGMDGFLLSNPNDDYAIGYYLEADRPFFNTLARNYTTLDRYFCSFLGPTFPNRFFLHAAQTDRVGDSFEVSTLPTIWDQVTDAGVSGLYYFSNIPYLALWGPRYQSISKPYAQFLADAAVGTLPAVSFVDPRFTIVDDGTGNDDHPHADIRRGDAFLADTFFAVANGPAWPSTVFIVTYDEWGGFFEHVAPPRAAAPNDIDPDLDKSGKALLGFRVPDVVASPFSLGDPDNPQVNSFVFDHTSILKLIEWRWGLSPLTARDASNDIENLALALNFDSPNPSVPELSHPVAPDPMPCFSPGLGGHTTSTAARTANAWTNLLNSSLLDGWPLAVR